MARFAPLLAALLLVSASPMVLAYGHGSAPPDSADEPSSQSHGNETNESTGDTGQDDGFGNKTDESTGGAEPDGEDAPSSPAGPSDENVTSSPHTRPDDANATRSDSYEREEGEREGRAPDMASTTESAERAPPGESSRDPPAGSDRGRRDPPVVRDTQGGFETLPPPAAQRPSVRVDAREGLVEVERAGVEPLAARLVSLLEYEDEDGDGAYDLGERVVVLHELRGREPAVVAGNGTFVRDIVHALDGGGQLVLRFALDPAGEGVGAKFDVLIEDYPFASRDTRLALGVHMASTVPLHATEVDGAPAVAASTGDEAAYLSWVANVTVDGVDHPVAWSVHTSLSDASAIVYWSYPQGARILHDPALGIMQVARDLLGEPLPFAVGLAATALLLGAGYETRRRLRR